MLEQLLRPGTVNADLAELRIVHGSVFETTGAAESDKKMGEVGLLVLGESSVQGLATL